MESNNFKRFQFKVDHRLKEPFNSAAPKLWNSLPAEIRNIQTLISFKRALKTSFFKTAFN